VLPDSRKAHEACPLHLMERERVVDVEMEGGREVQGEGEQLSAADVR
jgi:hypothetical protein